VWKRFSEEDQKTIWDMREAGVPAKRIAKHLGRENSSLRKFIASHGGRRSTPRQRSELRLSLEEREEISRGPGSGSVHPGHCRGTGPLPVDDLPRGERQRRLSEISSAPSRPGSCKAGLAAEEDQALPVPALAGSRRAQARGPVVSPADLFVVG
jgi:hypothetical protein